MLIVKGSVVLLIAICLFALKPLVAIAAAGSFFAIYFALYSLNRKFIARQAEILIKANTDRYHRRKSVGVKTVKAFECEDYFVDMFTRSANAYSQASANI
jgi:ABC-type transport system involved in Fe-S cluster assembly fused permease/ATPase subunit